MRYFHAYQFIFVSPKWLNNVLAAVVCQFVPIVGPIVLIGYAFEVIEGMLRDGEENYPDFDTNRLLPYLSRGVWPFVINLVATLPLSIVILASVITFYVVILTGQGEPPWWMLAMFAGLLFVVLFFSLVIVPFVVVPLSLRAGLGKSLKAAFDREAYVDFVKKSWKELFLTELFAFATGQVLTFVGMALCCVGVHVSIAWMVMARHHLMFQVYARYLERGGIPLVVENQPTPA
jgi:hypothetical protein